MANEIGWHFPPNNGGLEDGYNAPGIATFAGNRLRSLVRETLQNSLDAARNDLKEPVNVSFELVALDQNQEIGRQELQSALQLSCQAASEEKDPEEHCQALSSALPLLEKSKLTFLKISDRNTTGLYGANWRALVKMQGSSRKNNRGAGGSHGIGKYAAFEVSQLRTVYYWTCFEENGKQIEKFQGKSVLRSHKGAEGPTQGTGFFGLKHGCSELSGSEIDSRFSHFRILNEDGRPIPGTALWIAGFQGGNDWQRQIAESVIENFFHAISTGKLTVTLEPNNDMADRGLLEIDKSSLENWFEYVSEQTGKEELGETRNFWELTGNPNPTAEKEDNDFGHCKLWIRVGEGLPSKVALIRATGMLITTEQKGLIRFPGLQDFAAVCVFESGKGNELLRKMENPEHDKFEPDRLPEGEREKGKKALKQITEWIRGQIKDAAKPPQLSGTTVLSELARVLPDSEPDEAFCDSTGGGRGVWWGGEGVEGGGAGWDFSGRPSIKLKPRRRPKSMPPVGPEDEDVEGPGDEEESGYPPGQGGGSDQSQQKKKDRRGAAGKGVPIQDLRVVPLPNEPSRCRVSFMPRWSGEARLQFAEAGDSSDTPRDDIQAFDPQTGEELDLGKVALKDGERRTLEIESRGPIRNRAFCLRAGDVQTQ